MRPPGEWGGQGEGLDVLSKAQTVGAGSKEMGGGRSSRNLRLAEYLWHKPELEQHSPPPDCPQLI